MMNDAAKLPDRFLLGSAHTSQLFEVTNFSGGSGIIKFEKVQIIHQPILMHCGSIFEICQLPFMIFPRSAFCIHLELRFKRFFCHNKHVKFLAKTANSARLSSRVNI